MFFRRKRNVWERKTWNVDFTPGISLIIQLLNLYGYGKRLPCVLIRGSASTAVMVARYAIEFAPEVT
jgi:hypothetical protein